MDAVALLDEARAAGLKVRRDGDDLVVVGPENAATLVRRLAAHKAGIFTALEQQSEDVCYFCGEPAVRGEDGCGGWTDGQTVFGVTVHTRCARGDRPQSDGIDRAAIQAGQSNIGGHLCRPYTSINDVTDDSCSECGKSIDKSGIGWAKIDERQFHLACYRIGMDRRRAVERAV